MDHANHFLNYVFHPAVKRAALDPRLQPHDLRHTAATLMASAGFSKLDIQAQLGHARPGVTNLYIHLLDKDLKRKALELDLLYREAVETPERVSGLPTGRSGA